jgi:hypothetical protein
MIFVLLSVYEKDYFTAHTNIACVRLRTKSGFAYNGGVAVYTEILTDLWLLAGGEVAATIQDSFDTGLPLSADTVSLGSIRVVDVEDVLPKELFHQKPNERWDKSYEMLAEILGN